MSRSFFHQTVDEEDDVLGVGTDLVKQGVGTRTTDEGVPPNLVNFREQTLDSINEVQIHLLPNSLRNYSAFVHWF